MPFFQGKHLWDLMTQFHLDESALSVRSLTTLQTDSASQAAPQALAQGLQTLTPARLPSHLLRHNLKQHVVYCK